MENTLIVYIADNFIMSPSFKFKWKYMQRSAAHITETRFTTQNSSQNPAEGGSWTWCLVQYNYRPESYAGNLCRPSLSRD